MAFVKEGMIKKEEGKKKEKKVSYELVSYVELPEILKDNEYILRYYRAELPLKEAFCSLFRWHNETINIWTHLIGFLVILVLMVANLGREPRLGDVHALFTRSFPKTTVGNTTQNNPCNLLSASMKLLDWEHAHSFWGNPTPMATRWPLFVFLSGSMFCLLASSMCHLFVCHSHNTKLLLLRLDYSGIVIMIVASFFPPIYYNFHCNPHWQIIHLAAISAIGVFTLFTLLWTAVSSGTFRAFRSMLYIAMGLSGVVPAIHGLFRNWGDPRSSLTLEYEIAMALSYVTGALFYVSRVPERWKPGSFDLVGHSHQIFHVFVIAGALVHYAATLIFLEWRDRVG